MDTIQIGTPVETLQNAINAFLNRKGELLAMRNSGHEDWNEEDGTDRIKELDNLISDYQSAILNLLHARNELHKVDTELIEAAQRIQRTQF